VEPIIIPPLIRAVHGSIKIGKEIRTVEICGRDARVLVISITFPVYQILRFTAMEAGTNVVHLVFCMAVGEFYGWGNHLSTVALGVTTASFHTQYEGKITPFGGSTESVWENGLTNVLEGVLEKLTNAV
jgi:hypothetical protein